RSLQWWPGTISFGRGQRARAGSAPFRPKLEPEPSAALRAKLTTELEHISSADEAAIWAHRVIDAKNSLNAVDAGRVEQAVQSKLATFAREPEDEMRSDQARRSIQGPRNRRRSQAIDKTVLVLHAPRRIRDRDHVKSVAKQPCLVCGSRPADAHTCDLRSPLHWGVRSAMNLVYHCAGDIIAKSIEPVMRRRGG